MKKAALSPTKIWLNFHLRPGQNLREEHILNNFSPGALNTDLILTSLTPVFHTGSLRVEESIPWSLACGVSSIFDHKMSPILVSAF